MRMRVAAVLAAVLAASATVSSPALSGGDVYDTAPVYDMAPVPPQDLFEGWWLGGTVGGASVSYDKTPAGSVSSSGVVGGIIGGYSWQHGPFVVGVEGDFLASDVSGSRRYNGGLNKVSPGFDIACRPALARGLHCRCRTSFCSEPSAVLGPRRIFPSAALEAPSARTTFFGWSVGGGAEYAFDENWSARFDYQFTDFDAETVSYPGGRATFDPDSDTFRGSVIYRF